MELHYGIWVEKTIYEHQNYMNTPQSKTKKKIKFDLGELIGQLLFDFYARY